MKFQYNCIGSNIPENREHLDKLGMKRVGGIIGNIIMVNYGCYMCLTFDGKMGNNFNDAVKCIGNDPLFQAITAMREDSDYMQWFVCGITGDWVLHEYKERQVDAFSYAEGNDSNLTDVIMGEEYPHNPYHKATLAELQAHFQRV